MQSISALHRYGSKSEPDCTVTDLQNIAVHFGNGLEIVLYSFHKTYLLKMMRMRRRRYAVQYLYQMFTMVPPMARILPYSCRISAKYLLIAFMAKYLLFVVFATDL